MAAKSSGGSRRRVGRKRRERSRKGEAGGNLEFGQLMDSAKALSGCRRLEILVCRATGMKIPLDVATFSLLKPEKGCAEHFRLSKHYEPQCFNFRAQCKQTNDERLAFFQ